MSDECIFCHHDPYHYVDIGVGFQAAAVNCCELGIALYQHGDEELSRVADRIEELEDHLASMTGLWAKSDSEKQLLLARIEELEAKLAKAEVINGLLTVLAILNDPNDGRFPEAVDLAERFSTTLAELSSAMKGQDDE